MCHKLRTILFKSGLIAIGILLEFNHANMKFFIYFIGYIHSGVNNKGWQINSRRNSENAMTKRGKKKPYIAFYEWITSSLPFHTNILQGISFRSEWPQLTADVNARVCPVMLYWPVEWVLKSVSGRRPVCNLFECTRSVEKERRYERCEDRR